MEHPLDGAIEQHCMGQVSNLPVKPQMNSRNRGTLKVCDLLVHGLENLIRRQQRRHRKVRHSQNDKVEFRGALCESKNCATVFQMDTVDSTTQPHIPTTLRDVVLS